MTERMIDSRYYQVLRMIWTLWTLVYGLYVEVLQGNLTAEDDYTTTLSPSSYHL